MDKRGPGRGDDFPIEPLHCVDPVSLQGVPVPEREWLWPDWIPMRSVTLLSGDGGIGKSLLALQLATCCATKKLFLGKTVRHCKALFVGCEDEQTELHRRQVQINHAYELDMADLEKCKWVPRAGHDSTMMDFTGEGRGSKTPFFDQIHAMVIEEGFQLLILDTSADLFAGNENVRSQVKQFISGLTAIALQGNAAIVLLSHPSQLGRSSGTGESGSTGWSNSVRSRLYFSRPKAKEGELEDRDARILSREKSNYSASGAYVAMRYKDGAFEVTGGDEAEEGSSSLERWRKAEQAFVNGIQELTKKGVDVGTYSNNPSNFAPKQILAKTDEATGFSKEELEHAMNRLIKAGRIEQRNKGTKSAPRYHLVVIDPDFGAF